MALRIFAHFTAQECCLSVNWPLPPAVTSGAPWAAFTLSHISTAKQECLPLLHCLNLISSLPLPNSPIITLLLLSPFSACIQNLREREKKPKKLSTSKKHSDEWLFKSVIAGKIGLLCLWNGSGRECVDFFGHMHMRGAWCKGTLQTYIWTEGLNRFFFQKAVREAAHHKAWDWIHINKTVVQTFDWVNIWTRCNTAFIYLIFFSFHLIVSFFLFFHSSLKHSSHNIKCVLVLLILLKLYVPWLSLKCEAPDRLSP